jgi:RHS repeat-associated protein
VDYTFDALNAMLTAGPVDFDYDANGNRVRKTAPLTATGYLSVALQLGWELTGTVVTDYLYDYENRLTEVTRTLEYTEWVSVTGSISGTTELTVTQGISEAMHADYVYDGYGRRVAKYVTTAITETAVLTAATVFTREYVFDGLDPVYEYDFTEGAVTPTVESAYVYANGRMLLMERTEGGVSHTYWYHYDGLGSVVALTDETGADVCQWKYDEYGNLLQDCPALNHYTYTGQEYDAETGLLHFFARYYDAEVGVWVSQDSYRGADLNPLTRHRYMFALGNPVTFTDFAGYGVLKWLKEKVYDPYIAPIVEPVAEEAKDKVEETIKPIVEEVQETYEEYVEPQLKRVEQEYNQFVSNPRGYVKQKAESVQNKIEQKIDDIKQTVHNAADWVQENRRAIIATASFVVGAAAGFTAAAAICGVTFGLGCALMVGVGFGALAGVGTGLTIQSGANVLDSDKDTGITSHWGEAALTGGIAGGAGGAVGGVAQYVTGANLMHLKQGGYSLKFNKLGGTPRIEWHPLKGKRIPSTLQEKSLPHYHRRGPGGIGRHRPWEVRPSDTSFFSRF